MIPNYKTIPYTNNDLNLIDKLTKLSFKHGELRYCLLRTPQRLRHVILALGPRNGILGWAGIYKRSKMHVGVYVCSKYRHNGIGKHLREMAIEKVFRKNKSMVWHFRCNNMWEPIELRRP